MICFIGTRKNGPQKMVPRKNGPRRIGPRKIGLVTGKIGNHDVYEI